MKRSVNVWEYSGKIMESISKGILLTTKADGKVNTMIIGWGMMGVEWKEPIFIALVRKSRYTLEMLKKNPEFTVNIPLDVVDPQIVKVCGRDSGRDVDKIQKLGLTLEEPMTGSVPGIRQMPLTLECQVVYTQAQDLGALAPAYLDAFYGKGTPNEGDAHIAFYGKINAAYIIED